MHQLMASASSICKVSLGASSPLAYTPEAGALGATHPLLNVAELVGKGVSTQAHKCFIGRAVL